MIVSRQNETVLSLVPNWDRLSSAFEQLNTAFPAVKPSADRLKDMWYAVMSALVTEQAMAEDTLTELWVSAAKDGVVPVELPDSAGMVPISDVFVTTSIDRARRARFDGRVVVALDGPTIVGLSATPFRTGDDESRRLALRFDNRWLPSNQKHLYSRLRRKGVLAEARYEPLYSGVGLTDQELTGLGRLGDQWEGLDFENLLEAINQRLAGDAHRNEQLLECIRTSRQRSILSLLTLSHTQGKCPRG